MAGRVFAHPVFDTAVQKVRTILKGLCNHALRFPEIGKSPTQDVDKDENLSGIAARAALQRLIFTTPGGAAAGPGPALAQAANVGQAASAARRYRVYLFRLRPAAFPRPV